MIRDFVYLGIAAGAVYIGAAIAIVQAKRARKEVSTARDIQAVRQQYLEGKISLADYEAAERRAEHLQK